MSIAFPLQEIRDAEENMKLKKLLTLVGESKQVNYSRGSMFSQYQKKVIVNMYMVEDEKLHLPYTFAKNYFLNPKRKESERLRWEKYFEPKEYPPLFSKGKAGRFNGFLRDYQVDPYKAAKKYIKKYKTVTLEFYPSFGKTFFGSIFSWYLNAYTVILVHRETIADAWVKTYRAFLDVKDDQIVVVDKNICKKKRGQKKSPAERGKIFICMEQRWKYIPEEVRKKIKLLVIDEAHTFCAPSKVKPLLFLEPEYIISLTATTERVDDGLETMIETICGNHSVIKDNEKPFKFYVINTGIKIELEGSNNKFGELLEKQTKSEERNEIILNLIKRHSHFKTMFVGKRKEHCNMLMETLPKLGLECSALFGTIKKCESKNILIGTDSKMGTGFDEANACLNYDGEPSKLLIVGHSYKKRSAFIQVIGRSWRHPEPIVVVFTDSNRIVQNHIRSMKIWAEEVKGEVIVVKAKDIDKLILE
jgi:superfamily II DNA or RNA helicase